MKITKIIIVAAILLAVQSFNLFAQSPPTAKDSPTPSNGCVSGNCVNGKGKKTYDNGSNYEGDFVDGKEDGQGTLKYVEGSYYVGNNPASFSVISTFLRMPITFSTSFSSIAWSNCSIRPLT